MGQKGLGGAFYLFNQPYFQFWLFEQQHQSIFFNQVYCFQAEDQPKKTVAFEVDQVNQKLKDSEVSLKKENEEEDITVDAKLAKPVEKSHDEISGTVTGKLQKRIVKQVHLNLLNQFCFKNKCAHTLGLRSLKCCVSEFCCKSWFVIACQKPLPKLLEFFLSWMCWQACWHTTAHGSRHNAATLIHPESRSMDIRAERL